MSLAGMQGIAAAQVASQTQQKSLLSRAREQTGLQIDDLVDRGQDPGKIETLPARAGERGDGVMMTMEDRGGRRPTRISELTQEDLPQFVNQIVDEADRDKTEYMPDPRVPRRPSFMQAVQGIENGDYEGLEMLEFGAVKDGTPAVSFIDEDGQRQVIRLTVPQWFGALESRSRARAQFRQVQDLVQRKQAFQPYFDAMTKRVAEASDPDIAGYLSMMYEFDPEMAIGQLNGFLKDKGNRVMWRGKQVTPEFADTAQKAYDVMYKGKMRQYDAIASGLQDKPYGLAMLEGVRSLNRTPQDSMQPTQTTVIDNLRAQGGGVMPLVNLLQAMKTPGMVPSMPAPIVLPRPTEDGQYNPDEMLSFLDQFNQISETLGWGPVVAVDEQGISTLVEALNIANRTDGVLPRLPAAARVVPVSIQRQQMENEARFGTQASGEQGAMSTDMSMDGDAAIAEAIGFVKVNPTETDRAAMERILSLASDPERLEASTVYSPAQKAAIRRAAQVILDLSNR